MILHTIGLHTSKNKVSGSFSGDFVFEGCYRFYYICGDIWILPFCHFCGSTTSLHAVRMNILYYLPLHFVAFLLLTYTFLQSSFSFVSTALTTSKLCVPISILLNFAVKFLPCCVVATHAYTLLSSLLFCTLPTPLST